ncbi:MAG TPA: glycosyltransferase [Thermoplasmata archaeon]|nr:glycosyltransferase [Thermoplasmata archaeon]
MGTSELSADRPLPWDFHGLPGGMPFAYSSPKEADRPTASPPRVLVTVPVHNEVERLIRSIDQLDRTFRESGLSYTLSVAEDGSTDGTKALLTLLPSRYPGMLIQQAVDPLGRGRALRQLWSGTAADVYCFTDADLAAGSDALVEAVRMVMDGQPIVVGSRYAPGAHTTRPWVRSLVSRGYNALLRFLFDERIFDHQCGLKAFSAKAIRQLLPATREDSWFWDTEILILGLQAGYPIRELPVKWIEQKTSRTRYRRLGSDLYLHGSGIVRLRSRVIGAIRRRSARAQSTFDDPTQTAAPEP